ncbi:MAG: hypothetical protein JKY29_13530 [Gammaproteobacteria bacterium]|nr:hypothetical protein [Gammaproteobacteria bacterium]
MTKLTKLLAVGSIALFSQFALADAASAQKTIVDILAGMNHFPSDEQKAELMSIAADENSGRGLQMVATAVSNIQHAPDAEGKASMEMLIDYERASDDLKALAAVVLGFNHMASDDAKAVLAGF